MKDWKTTAAGILSALLAFSGPSTAFLAALQSIPHGAAPDYTYTIWGAALTFAFAVFRVWIGLLQNDSPAEAQIASIAALAANSAVDVRVADEQAAHLTQDEAPHSSQSRSSGIKALTALLCVGLGLGLLTGCNTWERTTFQTLAASKAVIDQAQADYEGGKALPHSEAVYKAVNDAKAAQTAAVNAMVVYEQIKATGTSSAISAQQQIVISLIADIPALIAAIKGLYTAVNTSAIQPHSTTGHQELTAWQPPQKSPTQSLKFRMAQTLSSTLYPPPSQLWRFQTQQPRPLSTNSPA
jgi:hypothetical protein